MHACIYTRVCPGLKKIDTLFWTTGRHASVMCAVVVFMCHLGTEFCFFFFLSFFSPSPLARPKFERGIRTPGRSEISRLLDLGRKHFGIRLHRLQRSVRRELVTWPVMSFSEFARDSRKFPVDFSKRERFIWTRGSSTKDESLEFGTSFVILLIRGWAKSALCACVVGR